MALYIKPTQILLAPKDGEPVKLGTVLIVNERNNLVWQIWVNQASQAFDPQELIVQTVDGTVVDQDTGCLLVQDPDSSAARPITQPG